MICPFHAQDDGWSSIMAWNNDVNAGFSSAEPWRPLNDGWEIDNVDNQNYTISVLSTMVLARQEKVRKKPSCMFTPCVALFVNLNMLFLAVVHNSAQRP